MVVANRKLLKEKNCPGGEIRTRDLQVEVPPFWSLENREESKHFLGQKDWKKQKRTSVEVKEKCRIYWALLDIIFGEEDRMLLRIPMKQ